MAIQHLKDTRSENCSTKIEKPTLNYCAVLQYEKAPYNSWSNSFYNDTVSIWNQNSDFDRESLRIPDGVDEIVG